MKNYVWYKSLHKNNVTIEAHWLHTFPLHLSFVASRLRPPLSTTPRTVAPAHQTRRDGLLHQTGYKAKGLLRCLECVQQHGPRRGYGALLPSRRRRLRSREDCHRKKGKATPFVLCTIISGVSLCISSYCFICFLRTMKHIYTLPPFSVFPPATLLLL